MTKCSDVNIPICIGCQISDSCWIEFYESEITFVINNATDIKKILLSMYDVREVYSMPYFILALKLHPKYAEWFEKIIILK